MAHALKDLPQISAMFREGRISYSKVRAMTRVATPKNEDYLLMIARHGTAHHIERLVRNYRKVKRFEALEEENTRHDQRELDWWCDDGGYWIFHGRFTPEQGAMIQERLEEVMEEIFQEHKGVAAETSDDQGYDDNHPRSAPIAKRRADAFVRMAQAYCSAERKTNNGGDRFLVHVHTDLETLRQEGTGAQAELEDFGKISAETSRRLACDAGVVHWLEDAEGNTLNVGRKTRSIPPSIRRALKKRDGGCLFPGCTCSRFVDAHHIHHWADGGETALHNLVLLCRRHHRLVHEEGFGIRKTAAGKIRFSDPAGKDIPDCADINFRGNVVSLFNTHLQLGIHITSKTTQSEWLGERMDDQLAVEGMLDRE